MELNRLIIDFHTHCFPDSIAGRAIESLAQKSGGLPFFHDGTSNGLHDFELAGGCDGYVMLPIATNPGQTVAVNRFAAQVQDNAKNIYAFGSVHPEDTDFKERLAEIKGLGLSGIKMHPEYQEFHVNDCSVFPVYEEIFRLGLPLIFHAGEDEGYRPPWHGQPYKIAEVARRYPEAVIIAAHLGGHNMWWDAAECLSALPNVYMDISFSAAWIENEIFRRVCDFWRPDRILFGTDSPWQKPQSVIEAVDKLPYPDKDKELIFSGNALRILGGVE